MDIIVYTLCLAFSVIFTLFGMKNDWLSVIAIVFNMSVVADIYVNGLTEVIGHSGGTPVTRNFGVDTVILIPIFFAVIGVFGILVRWRAR